MFFFCDNRNKAINRKLLIKIQLPFALVSFHFEFCRVCKKIAFLTFLTNYNHLHKLLSFSRK